MSHRRLVATASAVAASVALIPSLAFAADSPHAATATGTRYGSTATLAGAGSANLQTFSSPASKTVRVQTPAGAGAQSAVKSRTTGTTGRTLYAATQGCGPTDTGNGGQSSPYCDVQDAVNAAAPGDTIMVSGSSMTMGSSTEAITIKTSGISIIGTTNKPWIQTSGNVYGKPTFLLQGVSNVTISHMLLSDYGAPAIQVVGSSGITLDSDYLTGDTSNTVTIDGASSNVTVSRTYLDNGQPSGAGTAISVASGASNVTLAGNLLAANGISATGVTGLNVTGNTIQRGCLGAVDIEGASSGVNVENNLIEDADPNGGDAHLGGDKATCASQGHAWVPDVTVAAAASAGTTVDYNDFSIYGTDATAPYSWAGTSYPTLGAFQGAQSQGAHDMLDTKQAVPAQLAGTWYSYPTIDLGLQSGSAAINSANPNAPGALSTDFYGSAPHTDRGAVQYLSSNPTMAIALKAQDTSAYGVSLGVNVTTKAVPQTVTVSWGDGTQTSQYFWAGDTVSMTSPHTYAALGRYTISVTTTDTEGNSVVNSVQVLTAGSDYTAYGPTRLLDTRDGTGAAQGQVQPGASTRVKIAGNGDIPSGVTAVVLNVTVTDTSSGGFITAYGEGNTRPTTSNVNFTSGQTVPNLVIVPVGMDGYVDLYNGGWGPVNLVADVDGYFTQSASSGYTSIAPGRLVDSRNGTGTAQGQVGAGSSFAVQIAGNDGGQLPASGITAVALNVTVTNPGSDGHLTVYPDGQQTPNASNVNFTQGQTIANAVIVPVGSDGRIRVLNAAWMPADVIVDVVGYYSAAGKSAYLPIAPQRLLDTRDATTWKYGPVSGRGYVYMPLSAHQPDITGFVLNSTVTNTGDAGHLTVSPDPNSLAAYQTGYATWPATPSVSTLNWVPGATVPNLVQANAGTNGIIDFWNVSDRNLDLIVDAFGYYQND